VDLICREMRFRENLRRLRYRKNNNSSREKKNTGFRFWESTEILVRRKKEVKKKI
jgi:hypothetical protein